MTNIQKQEILLESGTNEMEIIEFYLNKQSFGINVHKLKEIIPFDVGQVTKIPDCAESVLGTLLLRGSTIPLIDLKKHLAQRIEGTDEEVREVVLVCEFNGRTNGFRVDGVNQIHRVNWSAVQPLAPFIDQYSPRFTGSINIDRREILIVDLEHIIAEFDPESALDYDTEFETAEDKLSLGEHRQQMRIFLAEDSSLIRNGIENILKSSGYSDLHSFIDGESCYAEIMRIKREVADSGGRMRGHLDLLITDIEMPKMDGLTLCRRVKEDPILKDVSVVLFSSLINEQMAAKCDSVGADGYATKPEIPKLVGMMDRLLFEEEVV
jgi:two-component system chemotaxis response regulator CheV